MSLLPCSRWYISVASCEPQTIHLCLLRNMKVDLVALLFIFLQIVFLTDNLIEAKKKPKGGMVVMMMGGGGGCDSGGGKMMPMMYPPPMYPMMGGYDRKR